MFEGRTNTKLCSDLFLIFTLRFTGALGAKFFDSIDTSPIFTASFDEADCPTGTTSKDRTQLSVLFG